LIEKYIEPSEAKTLPYGGFVELWFDINYELHSFMGQPACIDYIKGQIQYQAWYKKGVRHRDRDLPARIWHHSCLIADKEWYKNGNFIK